ncbi:MAG TPA: ABC transporter permease [Clostridiaceae bacterium]|nr:ABC transporter permease [Clostridiaceae bacterium]
MREIKALITLVSLKLRIIARKPSILLVCLAVPVLLSLLAGTTTTKNDYSKLDAAYVDQANNYSSQELLTLLNQGLVNWEEMTQDQAERELQQGAIDGLLIIPEGYGEAEIANQLVDSYSFRFIRGENSVASGMVRENVMVTAVTLASEANQLSTLMALDGAKNISLTEMRDLLRERTAISREKGANLSVNYIGEEEAPEGQIIEIPDYSIDVLFLSIFSLIGGLLLTDTHTRRRMLSVAGGARRDYLSTLLSLAVSGTVLLLLMVSITKLLMPGSTRPDGYLPTMLILLLLMLAYGQIIALIPAAESRIMPASLILLASLVLGGALLRLPALWLAQVGQFIPHGWIMARLSGIDTVLSPALVVVISLAVLVFSYFFQTNSRHITN